MGVRKSKKVYTIRLDPLEIAALNDFAKEINLRPRTLAAQLITGAIAHNTAQEALKVS